MNRKVAVYVLSVVLVVSLSACKVGRMVVYNFANITDYKIFPSRHLQHEGVPFKFHQAKQQLPNNLVIKGDTLKELHTILDLNHSVAFMVIRNDSILYEEYFNGYNKQSIVASFSMAKSVTSMLVGCAIDEGLITSIDDPITKYVPEIKDKRLEKVTVKHLLQMTSGIDFSESYVNPFGGAASLYYGRNLRKLMYGLKPKLEPGEQFEYISCNPQLLGLMLTNVLKDKTLTEYLQEKIWTPLGMEYDASWSLDKEKDGLEKTYCCLNARARDFAKLGRLYLNKGNWEGKQIVPEDWVAESTKLDTSNGSAWYYQYQWWIPSQDGAFMAEGILGQFIYVNPNKNLIIVRLGKKHGKVNWWEFFGKVAAGY